MVSVLPSSRMRGVSPAMPNTPSAAPAPIAVKKLVEAKREAAGASPLPKLRLMMLPEPCPSMNPMAWITAIRLDTTPTAPEALVEICPTKKVSARL